MQSNSFKIFDSHIHLNSLSQTPKLPLGGIDLCLNVCTSLEDVENTKSLKNVFHCLSATPQDYKDLEHHKKIFSFLNKNLKNNPKYFCAIGETGLDGPFHKENTEKLQLQMSMLKDYCTLSKNYKKPLIIHCREAFEELIDFFSMEENISLKGIIHCFTGNLSQATRLINLGWKISISGIITFKKSYALREVVKNIDIANILVETDAPYLSPVPFRGRENKIEYIKYTIQEIANIKELSFEEVANKTYENTKEILNIK